MNNLIDISLGIVCPMANERSNCERFVRETISVCKNFGFKSVSFISIFDKACTDGTYKILLELSSVIPELNVIYAGENKCVVDAYLRGYHEALNLGCDWILEMDSGYSHQPSDINIFFSKMKQGYDCVFGSRFCKGGNYFNSPRTRYLLSRGGSILTNILLGTKLQDMTSGFELFTHDSLKSILNKGIKSRGPFFQTEIKYHAHKFKIAEVPIQYNATGQTTKARYLSDSLKCLWTLFKQENKPTSVFV
jgi:dolichol-phosphate mannosyltransferase